MYYYPTVVDAGGLWYGTMGIIFYTYEIGQSRVSYDNDIVSMLFFTLTAVNLFFCEAFHNLTFFRLVDIEFSRISWHLIYQKVGGKFS